LILEPGYDKPANMNKSSQCLNGSIRKKKQDAKQLVELGVASNAKISIQLVL